ncbi:MAG: hypothetical protein AB1486_21260 [Planctomycetota bacterium]
MRMINRLSILLLTLTVGMALWGVPMAVGGGGGDGDGVDILPCTSAPGQDSGGQGARDQPPPGAGFRVNRGQPTADTSVGFFDEGRQGFVFVGTLPASFSSDASARAEGSLADEAGLAGLLKSSGLNVLKVVPATGSLRDLAAAALKLSEPLDPIGSDLVGMTLVLGFVSVDHGSVDLGEPAVLTVIEVEPCSGIAPWLFCFPL